MTIYLIWDGECIPVTNFFDVEDMETSDPEEALTFVAGPLASGGFVSGLWVNMSR